MRANQILCLLAVTALVLCGDSRLAFGAQGHISTGAQVCSQGTLNVIGPGYSTNGLDFCGNIHVIDWYTPLYPGVDYAVTLFTLTPGAHLGTLFGTGVAADCFEQTNRL